MSVFAFCSSFLNTLARPTVAFCTVQGLVRKTKNALSISNGEKYLIQGISYIGSIWKAERERGDTEGRQIK